MLVGEEGDLTIILHVGVCVLSLQPATESHQTSETTTSNEATTEPNTNEGDIMRTTYDLPHSTDSIMTERAFQISPGFSSRLERGPRAQFSLGTSPTWWAVFVPRGKS